jgi:hypothetical protein
VPAWKSARWNLSLLCVAITILLLVVIAWPTGAFLRWKYAQPSIASGRDLLAMRVLRLVAILDIAYLLAWIVPLAPVLQDHLEAYNNSLDPYLRVLQIAGLFVIANAAETGRSVSGEP